MIYHTRCVARGTQRAMVDHRHAVHDVPARADAGARSAGRLVKEGGAHAVKLEGGERTADAIAAIVAGRHSGHGPRRAHAAVGPPVRRVQGAARRGPPAGRRQGRRAGGGVRRRGRVRADGTGEADHRVGVDPDDRHRGRRRTATARCSSSRTCSGCTATCGRSSSSGTPRSGRDPPGGRGVLPRGPRGPVPGRGALISVRPTTSSAVQSSGEAPHHPICARRPSISPPGGGRRT